MGSKLRTGLFAGIFVLTAVGIIGMLLQNPGGLMKNILSTIVIAAIIGAVLYFFLQGKNTEADKKYAKALRKHKKSAAAKSHFAEHSIQNAQKKNILPLRKSRKSSSHLYVIEGKKNKKKA